MVGHVNQLGRVLEDVARATGGGTYKVQRLGYYTYLLTDFDASKHQGRYAVALTNGVPLEAALMITATTPDLYLGTWYDGSNVVIDLVLVLEDRDTALQVARECHQQAIYDLQTKEVVWCYQHPYLATDHATPGQ